MTTKAIATVSGDAVVPVYTVTGATGVIAGDAGSNTHCVFEFSPALPSDGSVSLAFMAIPFDAGADFIPLPVADGGKDYTQRLMVFLGDTQPSPDDMYCVSTTGNGPYKVFLPAGWHFLGGASSGDSNNGN